MITLHGSRSKPLRFALTSALAAVLLTGCAGGGKFAEASSRAAKSSEKADRAVAVAEKAVERSPRDAALRIALGQAYMQAGRFDSAASAFNDALTLGDAGGSTALRLALSEVGAGNQAEALAVLDQYHDRIPASDLGLALALAGETTRGVTVLADALRAGDDTPKTRQNLAYAYALDGRWREARVMAAQDVPADQLDARISDWAMQGRPEDSRQRVASLLQVEPRSDPGQPERLALGTPAAEQPAVAAAVAPVAAPVATPAELPALVQAPSDAGGPAIADTAASSAPPLAPAPAQSFAVAFAAPAPVSQPVVQPLPMRPLSMRTARATPMAATPAGGHLVQLGSFSSERNARKAWSIYTKRHPELRQMHLAIIPAVVRGKSYWRVAASGLTAGAAQRACSTVRGRGGACFAYAATRAPAGARATPSFASADFTKLPRR